MQIIKSPDLSYSRDETGFLMISISHTALRYEAIALFCAAGGLNLLIRYIIP